MGVKGAVEFKSTERFTVLRQLGAGGMGIVYEAFDRERGMRVALKTLPHVDARALYLFKQEFRALADVVHPNLVSLYELVSVDEQWFFTMELIDGVNLLGYVRPGSDVTMSGTMDYLSSSTFTPQDTQSDTVTVSQPLAPLSNFGPLRNCLQQLAEGLAALHAAGKLHRDIKPANVLVTKQGRVVLLDFGLVTELEPKPQSHRTEQHLMGTIAYMAPEQAAGMSLTPASDWYAVGVMLYEALTGRLPFLGRSLEVLADKQKFEPPAPSELVPGIPDDLNALCVDLLRRRPEARPSARDILRRLGVVEDPATAESVQSSQHSGAFFVGREGHLKVLAGCIEQVQQRNAVTVFVHGKSGQGKSTLLQHFLKGLMERDEAVVLQGRCYEHETVPFKALDSVIDDLSRYLSHLARLQAEALLPRDVAALTRVFPVLLRVEAVACAPRVTQETPDQQELRRRAFGALRELMARLSDRKRLILWIDDLQWGDVDSAALLSEILRPPDQPALLLIASYRSEDANTSAFLQTFRSAHESYGASCQSRELPVEPLSEPETRDLAVSLLGRNGPATDAIIDAIVQESHGNPYFVAELVRHVQAGAELTDRKGPSGPIVLENVLWSRIVRLPEEARRLLEVVAVAGQRLRQSVALQAAEITAIDRMSLGLLRTGHLVRTTGPEDWDEIETYHDRIRETVVAQLPGGTVKQWHLRLAIALESSGAADAESLARHFEGAEDHQRAAQYYARAADHAAEALAFDRAAQFFRRSLELGDHEQQEARALHVRLGDALANAGRGSEAAQEYLVAADGATAGEALELRRRAAMQYLISGHIDDGLAALQQVLSAVGLSQPTTPLRTLISLLLRRARVWLRGIQFRERDTSQISAEELSRIDICWSAAEGLSMVDTIRGADFQARNLLLALRAGEPYRIARALAWEAMHVASTAASDRRTARLLEASDNLARRVGHPHALGMVALARGMAAYLKGRYGPARDSFRQAEEIFRDQCTGVAWELDTTHIFSMWTLFLLGEIADLVRQSPLIKEAEERGDLYAAASLAASVGVIGELALDNPSAAQSALGRYTHEWSRQGFHVQHYWGLVGQVFIWLYSGDGTAAWDHITKLWPALASSLLLRVQTVRISALDLHACCALAAAPAAPDPQALLRIAERDARRLERENAAWAKPMAQFIQAGVAAERGAKDQAIRILTDAAAGFDAIDMRLYATIGRRRKGELIGGKEGAELIEASDAWMIGQSIKNPPRMAAMLVPGFQGAI